jgi:hypothetical protein
LRRLWPFCLTRGEIEDGSMFTKRRSSETFRSRRAILLRRENEVLFPLPIGRLGRGRVDDRDDLINPLRKTGRSCLLSVVIAK